MAKPAPNRTLDGQLACAYGTPWEWHFKPPVGNSKGCVFCDAWTVGQGLLDFKEMANEQKRLFG